MDMQQLTEAYVVVNRRLVDLEQHIADHRALLEGHNKALDAVADILEANGHVRPLS